MTQSVAEAYLLIVRESFVPIIGEAIPFPFTGQIELDSWKWDLKNDKRIALKKKRDEAKEAAESGTSDEASSDGTQAKTPPFKEGELIRALTNLQRQPMKRGESQTDRDKKVRELIQKAIASHEAAVENAEAKAGGKKKQVDPEGRMSFTFEKNVDLASTQLLNAMANGDLMPRAVLTLYHRSSNAPVTLAITFGDVRLKSYELSVDPSETMSDMKETWTATYETLNWAYHNRPAASGPNYLTQEPLRVFAMAAKGILPF
jgi:type VI protein secretion system component Hcp